MSSKMKGKAKRRYRKRRRAEQEDQTRLRITEAAVGLHGTVGPARTTVSAVAERAGVQRATVYRHFPDDEALFAACSAHWIAAHPLPEIAAWAEIADPQERLVLALGERYAWFEGAEQMLERTTRDAAVVPAMERPVAAAVAWAEAAVDVLMRGRPQRGARRRDVRAAIAHALAFPTWRSLVREQELPPAAAIDLMAALVVAAGE
jgi:AcrR family transcriptional regulator